jgi:hypothetical protein
MFLGGNLHLVLIFLSVFSFLWRYSPNLGLGLPPWISPFHFDFLDLRQSVGFLGRVIGSSQGSLPVHKHRKTHTQTLNIHALGGIRTHDPCFPVSYPHKRNGNTGKTWVPAWMKWPIHTGLWGSNGWFSFCYLMTLLQLECLMGCADNLKWSVWKDSERIGRGLFQGTNPSFAWRELEIAEIVSEDSR